MIIQLIKALELVQGHKFFFLGLNTTYFSLSVLQAFAENEADLQKVDFKRYFLIACIAQQNVLSQLCARAV